MLLDVARARQCLKDFNLEALFIEELGWDRCTATLDVSIDGQTFTLTSIAEKRGMVAYVCSPLGYGRIPAYALRRKIERHVAKSVHEHLIIYTDMDKTAQIWQWVKREISKPAACREHSYHRNQPGDALIQKLQSIAFSLEEEETITLFDVTSRTRAAFDVERVTRRFYDRFKAEHAAFLGFLDGIPDEEMQRWYASVMINRLMFIYFIQKKGFLNNDIDYLRNQLRQSKQRGEGRFYKDFLCPLFFEGFAKQEKDRSLTTNQLLGKVPYLNGGLFLRHQVEELHGEQIRIVDAAFAKLFEFFDQYQWHLDERPLRADNEINPDVLGYIFEKYINQKQMGAYYTKEDITDYISKNTVVPFLFNAARQKCKIAFEGEQSVWRLLQADPDRYFYDAVKKGVELPLPEEIAIGLNDVSKRTEWNKPAPEEYALPTEIWREVVARRKRYEDIRAKLVNGEVQSINDPITYNLDIRQFAQDVIENCEGPELLRAFWHAIVGRMPERSNEKFEHGITILDPTCGSGAFLFAALNILEPLYEACLDRMEVFLDELDRSGEKHRSDKFSDFRKVLDRMVEHPNRRYFILKSIIINNLFGVDIMEEAVEICKLRLFLKLVAQVERVEDIEPLPDIDFNIRAGNTLVGFATRDAVNEAITGAKGCQGKVLYGECQKTMERIDENAEIADRAFQKFREMQTMHGMSAQDFANAKLELSERSKALNDELNRYLASEYGIDLNNIVNKSEYERRFRQWLVSHKPFHWFVEFYGIIKNGGFDVIIGNPPYVELSEVSFQYSIIGLELVKTRNLHSICTERFSCLATQKGHVGIIVPISAVSTPRMLPLMELVTRELSPLYISTFAVRPGKLFVGADMNLAILIGQKTHEDLNLKVYSTRYNRWHVESRPFLFATLVFTETTFNRNASSIPKIGSTVEARIMQKALRHGSLVRYQSTVPDSTRIFYHSGGRYFRKCIRDKLSNEYKELKVHKDWEDALICLLSSSFYYMFWIEISDCYHVTKRNIEALPVPESLKDEYRVAHLAETFLNDLWDNAEKRIRNRADGSQQREVNFYVAKSKPIIDEIDRVLAEHYGFTDEELDFIINYDIKYRMGLSKEDGIEE